jgi:tetratricopeptide (TPR) repeat protein
MTPGSSALAPAVAEPPTDPADHDVFEASEATVAEGPHSDVHALPSVPYEDEPAGDPFADFEDDLEGDSTRIDSSHLIAEESTTILHQQADPPYLAVESGKDEGKRFVLLEGETSIGRSIDNDVILTDISVSRKHLKIEMKGDTLLLKDLGSGNGSLLNGQRVRDTVLKDGDRIEIGETIMVIQAPRLPASALPLARAPSSVMTSPALSGPPTVSAPIGGAALTGPSFVAAQHPFPAALPHYGYAAPVLGVVKAPFWASIPKPWLFGLSVAAIVFVAMLGATVTALILEATSGDETAESTVTIDYNAGMAAFAEGRYDESRAAFERVIRERPEDADARRALERAEVAVAHEDLLDEAASSIAQRNWSAALEQVREVPSTSPLADRAREVGTEAQRGWLGQLRAAADRAIANGNLDIARRQLVEAQRAAPRDPVVREIATAIAAAERASAAEEAEAEAAAESPSPRASSDRPTHASAATARSNRTPTPTAMRSTPPRASNRTSTTNRTSPSTSRPTRGPTPIERDRVPNAQLTALIGEARELGTRGTAGCRAAIRARDLDATNADVRQLIGQCQSEAQQVLRQADAIAGRNGSAARTMYRQVLGMVPIGSPPYQRAQAGIRRLQQDEDQ